MKSPIKCGNCKHYEASGISKSLGYCKTNEQIKVKAKYLGCGYWRREEK